MEDFTLPVSALEFNLLDKEKRINAFWCFIASHSCNSKIFEDDSGTWSINEANGYFVISYFTYPNGWASDFFKGNLENIYASEDLLDFVFLNKKDIWQEWINTTILVKDDENPPPKFYLSHFLFIDAPYQDILERISSYFYNDFRMCQVNSDDQRIDSELISNWKASNNRNSAVLYLNGYEAGIAGSGITIRIENTHLQLAEDDLIHPIPFLIFNKCSTVPHIVEIFYSRLWKYPDLGTKIMRDLALKFEGRAFMISSDYNIMAIKSNKYLSVEEKIYYLYDHLTGYITEEDLNLSSEIVSKILGEYWDMLSENSRIFLATGYSLYQYALRSSTFLFDTSLPSLAFAKCIENEVIDKIMIPFKLHFEKNFNKEDLCFDLKDEQLKTTASFLLGNAKTPPELGTLSHFLKNAINSKKRAIDSGSIRAFKSFCSTRKNPDFFINEEKLCTKLFLISSKYRNGGAHIKVLPLEYVIEFYTILFKEGFIIELLESSQEKGSENYYK